MLAVPRAICCVRKLTFMIAMMPVVGVAMSTQVTAAVSPSQRDIPPHPRCAAWIRYLVTAIPRSFGVLNGECHLVLTSKPTTLAVDRDPAPTRP